MRLLCVLVLLVNVRAEAMAGCTDKTYRKLDFWTGTWRVLENGHLVGTNSIEPVLGGCAILEHWRDREGGEGKSLFYFDSTVRTWKQVWVTDTGFFKEKQMIATYEDGGVRFQGLVRLPDGTLVLDRTTLTPLPESRVRQVIEQSRDGGRTWRTTFDAVYVRDTQPE